MERSKKSVLSSVDIKDINVTIMQEVSDRTLEPMFIVRELHGPDGVEYRKEFTDYSKAMDYYHALIEGIIY
jgi:hypothetical protein